MNRRIQVIATGTSNLNIEFIHKGVCQTRKRVHEETISGVCCSNDVLTIASPLIGSFNSAVFQLSGKSYHIVLASVVRTDDVHNSIRIHCDDHIVGCVCIASIGCNTAGNGILTCGITTKRERSSSGVGRMVVHQPDLTNLSFATAILIIAQAERGHIVRARQAQALRLRWGHLDDRIRIYGF